MLTRGRRAREAAAEEEARHQARRTLLLLLEWVSQVFGQAPCHVLGNFLDRCDFASLENTSATLQGGLRNIIRARNDELPLGKQLPGLEGSFSISQAAKDLLKREGRGGVELVFMGGIRDDIHQATHSVKSLDLLTNRSTALPPMALVSRPLHTY